MRKFIFAVDREEDGDDESDPNNDRQDHPAAQIFLLGDRRGDAFRRGLRDDRRGGQRGGGNGQNQLTNLRNGSPKFVPESTQYIRKYKMQGLMPRFGSGEGPAAASYERAVPF